MDTRPENKAAVTPPLMQSVANVTIVQVVADEKSSDYIDEAIRTNQANVAAHLLTKYKYSKNKLHLLLCEAAKFNALDALIVLHKAGASLTEFAFPSELGELYLHLGAYFNAIESGHLAVLKYLFEAEPQQIPRISPEILRQSSLCARLDVFQYVFSVVAFNQDRIQRQACYAVALGKTDILQYIIKEYKPEIPIKDKIDFAECLASAIVAMQLEIIKWLLINYKVYCEAYLPSTLTHAQKKLKEVEKIYCTDAKNKLREIINFLAEQIPAPAKQTKTLALSSRPSFFRWGKSKEPEQAKVNDSKLTFDY